MNINSTVLAATLGYAGLFFVGCGGETGAPADYTIGKTEKYLSSASDAEGVLIDLELVAESLGISLEQAILREKKADAVGEIAETIYRELPEKFVGSALAEDIDGEPILYVKGGKHELIDELLSKSPVEIKVEYSQPFSFFELEERVHDVQMVYYELGLTASSYFDIQKGGKIISNVVLKPQPIPEEGQDDGPVERLIENPEDLPEQTVEGLRALLPSALKDSVEIIPSDAAGFSDDTIIGGAEARDNNVFECTTGFNVYEFGTNEEGITTAGHCDGIDRVKDHVTGAVVSVNHEGQHRGQWGDIEWKTKWDNGGINDDFHTSSSNVRDVKRHESIGNMTIGETVCFYGRSSNSPTCDPTITAVSVSCTVSGVWNDRLVQVDDEYSIGGDSGSPWFYSYGAFGTTKGRCSGMNLFSAADYFDEALGVIVDKT